ncbi:MAG: glucose-6-phosphate isomerase [Deltaproteobacteria bacterium]|nr:glucose-6-phosphate isomerase [Deltaproteobacteria bacterium]
MKMGNRRYQFALGGFEAEVGEGMKKMRQERVMSRIWAHDHTLWKDDPAEIANRLGWLHSPETMVEAIPGLMQFVEGIKGQGYTRALLLGMGGSSLAPEMFSRIFGAEEGYLDLFVLDSTDPGAVLAAERRHDPRRTLYIVSTKSGGTIETLSFMKYFYNRAKDALGEEGAGAHFIAITDPGSSLQSMAERLGFCRVFLNDPNIGGRYSALSYFGLVPAALMGRDLAVLLERAGTMARNSEGPKSPVRGNNSSALLGAAMGELANRGLDKLTLVTSPGISAFGAWVEQLIAESTGKEGKGILPVQGEDLKEPQFYSRDRVFAYLRLDGDSTHDTKIEALRKAGFPVFEFNLKDPYDIGGECFRWEMATAVAGWFLGINPFDQPNVESAKVLARKMVETYIREGRLPEPEPAIEAADLMVYSDFPARSPEEALEKFLSLARQGEDGFRGRSYVAIQAFIAPGEETDSLLQDLRTSIQTAERLATTVGYGPRFLHSTGQLHKGDGGRGLFIQITADIPVDLPIPDEAGSEKSSISFGVLKMAQALGDRQALLDAGRRVIRFHFRDKDAGLERLARALG